MRGWCRQGVYRFYTQCVYVYKYVCIYIYIYMYLCVYIYIYRVPRTAHRGAVVARVLGLEMFQTRRLPRFSRRCLLAYTIYVYMLIHIYIYIYIYIHTHTHTYTYIYIYTHMYTMLYYITLCCSGLRQWRALRVLPPLRGGGEGQAE